MPDAPLGLNKLNLSCTYKIVIPSILIDASADRGGDIVHHLSLPPTHGRDVQSISWGYKVNSERKEKQCRPGGTDTMGH